MKLGQVLPIALGALMRNKTRSFLTALGVIIGVASVISMAAVGEGAKARVAAAELPFETPDADQRAARIKVVAAMIYLIFNEGYERAHRPLRVHVVRRRHGRVRLDADAHLG